MRPLQSTNNMPRQPRRPKHPTCLLSEQPRATAARRGLGRMAFLGLAAAAIALGAVIYVGIRTRTAAEANLTRATAQAAIPTVDVVYPTAGAPTQEIVLPGNTQAFTSAPIYARTSGYLKRWYFDIGAQCQARPVAG